MHNIILLYFDLQWSDWGLKIFVIYVFSKIRHKIKAWYFLDYSKCFVLLYYTDNSAWQNTNKMEIQMQMQMHEERLAKKINIIYILTCFSNKTNSIIDTVYILFYKLDQKHFKNNPNIHTYSISLTFFSHFCWISAFSISLFSMSVPSSFWCRQHIL